MSNDLFNIKKNKRTGKEDTPIAVFVLIGGFTLMRNAWGFIILKKSAEPDTPDGGKEG